MAGKIRNPVSRNYNIQGNVTAGRDVILGNQQINNTQVTKIETPADFVAELQRLNTEIESIKKKASSSKSDLKRLESVQENIQQVVQETQKSKPSVKKIEQTLDGAKSIMEKVSGNINTVIGLGAIVAELTQAAMKIFGR